MTITKGRGTQACIKYMTITEGIITMTTTGLSEISSPSSKFFSTCSKFSDVPLFRPNSFIEDDLRVRRCYFSVKPAKESFVMEVIHGILCNLLCYLSNIITYSIINI